MKLAAPGQVILRRYDSYLDGKFIPGKYSHSGIVESNESVIHAVAEDVCRADILDFVKDADGICILEAEDPSYSPEAAVAFARRQIGKPYDFGFNVEATRQHDEIKAFFCHKLTAMSLWDGGIRIVPVVHTLGTITHEVYLAEQLVSCPKLSVLMEAP
jgi:uncharacterized protein YycO